MKKIVLFCAPLAFLFVACVQQPVSPTAQTGHRVLTKNVRTVASNPAQQQVDSECFVAYSQAAGRCNTSAGDDDVAFMGCLRPVKIELKHCCKQNGGSTDCAADAE